MRTNKYISIGILFVAVTILLNHLIQLPEFFSGLGYGTGIALELIGVYSINHDLSIVKGIKSKIIKNFINSNA